MDSPTDSSAALIGVRATYSFDGSRRSARKGCAKASSTVMRLFGLKCSILDSKSSPSAVAPRNRSRKFYRHYSTFQINNNERTMGFFGDMFFIIAVVTLSKWVRSSSCGDPRTRKITPSCPLSPPNRSHSSSASSLLALNSPDLNVASTIISN